MSATADWGDIPTWIGSIGTVLTLGLGVLLLGRELADRRRRNASRMYCWIDYQEDAVKIRNAGDEPMTKVMIALFALPGHYVEPFTGHDDNPIVEDWEWFGPGDEKILTPEGIMWDSRLFPPKLRMEFTDASRRRWLRDEHGTLSRKHVIPYRQDWRASIEWMRHARENRRARKLFTRWRWPDL